MGLHQLTLVWYHRFAFGSCSLQLWVRIWSGVWGVLLVNNFLQILTQEVPSTSVFPLFLLFCSAWLSIVRSWLPSRHLALTASELWHLNSKVLPLLLQYYKQNTESVYTQTQPFISSKWRKVFVVTWQLAEGICKCSHASASCCSLFAFSGNLVMVAIGFQDFVPPDQVSNSCSFSQRLIDVGSWKKSALNLMCSG